MNMDQAKLDQFLQRVVGNLAAGYGGVMISIGDKLGLYRAMAGADPLSATEVARRAGCAERYVRESSPRAPTHARRGWRSASSARSAFTTDDHGNARFAANFSPSLEGRNEQLLAMRAIAWHSDGETHGSAPGSFGHRM